MNHKKFNNLLHCCLHLRFWCIGAAFSQFSNKFFPFGWLKSKFSKDELKTERTNQHICSIHDEQSVTNNDMNLNGENVNVPAFVTRHFIFDYLWIYWVLSARKWLKPLARCSTTKLKKNNKNTKRNFLLNAKWDNLRLDKMTNVTVYGLNDRREYKKEKNGNAHSFFNFWRIQQHAVVKCHLSESLRAHSLSLFWFQVFFYFLFSIFANESN